MSGRPPILAQFTAPILLAALLALAPHCAAPQTSDVDTVTSQHPERTLHIAAINDFHGAFFETPHPTDPALAMGGLPWVSSTIRAMRSEHPDLLLLDGGDLFQGSWPVNATRGRAMVEAFHLLGVDATCVGNHEFDYGPTPTGGHPLRGALEAAAEAARFHWLAANVLERDVDTDARRQWAPSGITPSVLMERSGVRIGLIGISTQDTPQTTLSAHVADLVFTDPVETVRTLSTELRGQGAEVIIVLAHITGNCDPPDHFAAPPMDCMPGGEMGRLLTELPRGTIDVLIAGHAHTLLAQRIGDTFVLENRAKGQAIGRLDLVVGPQGVLHDASRMHPPTPIVHPPAHGGCGRDKSSDVSARIGPYTLQSDPHAAALIARIEEETGSLCERVGCADGALLRDRHAESPLGSLVADAMRRPWPDADVFITNSGGLRADLPAGDILREHIHAVMPFNNRVRLLHMPGRALRRFLEIGTSGAHGLLQLSGARVRFDPHQKQGHDLDGDGSIATWERLRLCEAWVGEEPLDDQRQYRVVTTDFIPTGGDHYGPAFDEATFVAEGPLLRELITDFIQELSACVPDPASAPTRSPRIRAGKCSPAP